ncbi:uncharacterized protein LOC112171490 [Rosa chinensis]|uniref:uncharacterized protein LOC112171490 n=1 Tax=Rosa chinensis TaxID=74649 RepID=UPI000D093495|nr:uncharacterized protein LOC112171490 [Rosa chinensis]
MLEIRVFGSTVPSVSLLTKSPARLLESSTAVLGSFCLEFWARSPPQQQASKPPPPQYTHLNLYAVSILCFCSVLQINTSVGESIAPITPHEGTSTATPEVQGTQATQLEDDGSVESILEALKRKERSDIWNHFERDMVDGRIKGQCNYCGKIYYADPRKNGTTSLNNHMDRCPKYPPNIEMMKV